MVARSRGAQFEASGKSIGPVSESSNVAYAALRDVAEWLRYLTMHEYNMACSRQMRYAARRRLKNAQ